MYFSVHFIFPALVLNFVLNHKFFAIIFKDRDIGCPRSTSQELTVRSNHANRDTIGGLAFHCQQSLMMFVWFEWKPLSHPAVTFQIPLIQ